MKTLKLALLFIAMSGLSFAGPKVELDTSKGKIIIEVDEENAPTTAKNFLKYVEDKFYDGVVFHRVIPDFMIQGGGFTKDGDSYTKKATREEIENEADNGLKNKRGTLAMARTSDPHSASAQFFINHKDNDFLDHTSKTGRGWGYAVFAKVVEGMDVVDAIAETSTKVKTADGNPMQDWPVEDVVIKSAKIIKAD